MSPVIEEILRALREDPEVREAVRREILTQELLALPTQFEVFRRKHDEDIARLEQLIVQNRLETDNYISKLRIETSNHLASIILRFENLERDFSVLLESDLERKYRERAHAIFGRFLTRVQIVKEDALLDELNEVNPLSEVEIEELLSTDLILTGVRRSDRERVYVMLEASWVIDESDVRRAAERAKILNTRGHRAVPVVGGQQLTEGAIRKADDERVAILIGGKPITDYGLHAS